MGGSVDVDIMVTLIFLTWFWSLVSSHYLIFDEVDITLKYADIFGSMLSGECGSANGWWCCWGASDLPYSPPDIPKNPSPPAFVYCFFVFAQIGATSDQYIIWTAGGNPVFVWEEGWEEPLWYFPSLSYFGIWGFCIASRSLLSISMERKQEPRALVLMMACMTMLHANLCGISLFLSFWGAYITSQPWQITISSEVQEKVPMVPAFLN
jgi:hypothetical protein